MTIKEIEELSGMTRANIRYYEKEGLLAPRREFNSYRDYSDDDLATILRIRLLRNLNISLNEIKALQSGKADLPDLLMQKSGELEQIRQDVTHAQNICETMRQDGVTYATLDARKYLDAGIRMSFEPGFFTPRTVDLVQVDYPWRRYLARTLDMSLYLAAWQVFLALALRVNLLTRSNYGRLLDTIIMLGLMLIVEPLLLHLFGTTLGKHIFGLRLETEEGRKPAYYDGLIRTWDVIQYGYGYAIPFYNLYTLWKSYRRCEDREPQPWDGDLVYSIRDTKWYRGVAFIGVNVLLAGLVIIAILAARVPPNRGALTVAEFAENYNTMADHYGVSYHRLDANGKWIVRSEGYTVFVGSDAELRPDITFMVQNGYVTGLRWAVMEGQRDNPVYAYDMEMLLSALAFVGAQREAGTFSGIRDDLAKTISSSYFSNYTATQAGVRLNYIVSYSGYRAIAGANILVPEKEGEKNFNMVFSMDKIS